MITLSKAISIIHNPKFSGLPTHYPSLAIWNRGCIDIAKIWKRYHKGKEDVGIYVNIPLCATKCKFCFLEVVINSEETQQLYIESLIYELEILSKVIDNKNPIKSIYIGGGTPNILSERNLEKLLKKLHSSFNLKECKQISMESNPDFWNKDKINIIKNYGVNFVTIGVQSFNKKISKLHNRFHKTQNISQLISLFKKNNIKINIDLLLGISDEKIFFSDLEKVLKLLPDQIHINRIKYSNITNQEKERLINLQNKAFQFLTSKGYKRLDEDSATINNSFNIQGNPDFQIYSSIIAAGTMSLGHIYGKVRYQNVYDLKSYKEKIKEGRLPVLRYCFIDEKDEITHYCLNKILRGKVDLEELNNKFSKEAIKSLTKRLNRLVKKGIITLTDTSYSIRGEPNWYEITKELYSPYYLAKVIEKYRLT